MTEEERLEQETDYFECHCTVHISLSAEICGLHKMKRLPHGVLPTGPAAQDPTDVLSINPNKKRNVTKECEEAKKVS